MYKINKLLRWLVLCLCISASFTARATADINLKSATEYVRNVRSSLDHKTVKFSDLKDMLSDIQTINYQADHCVQIEKDQLSSISDLESHTGVNEKVNENSEDVLYLKNKKEIHYSKLAKCRLLSFKTQDLIADLKHEIVVTSNSNVLTMGEQIWHVMNNKQGALLTIAMLVLFIGIVYVGKTIFSREKILKSLYTTRMKKFFEIKLLKFSLYCLIIGWFTLFLLQWWEVSSVRIDKITDFMLNGTTIYSTKLIPLRLLIALLVFSVIQIVGKYFAVRVSEQSKFEDEEDTQVVISSLVGYMVFALALVCALLISGVDFTGLAIVAGALSVGIGLGLQNVVNNFVSGLILLIEKPIQPGDRIMIKGYEGFVKKISIRSTRIVTLLKEDVIIPNSDLIGNPITNLVFNDTMSKLSCSVGVSYDSDLELVKNTLLNIAQKQPGILKDPLNKPIVQLKTFGESCLNFELGCVVEDINTKHEISSNIHFMIVQAFRDNNIVMAFPQIDVHVVGADAGAIADPIDK